MNCLLGDNGAGKSTLIKTLSGVHRPDEGQLLMDGEPVTLASPRDAQARGIATVYQDLAVLPLMSISRNFFLGNEPTKGAGPFRRFDMGFADRIGARADARDRHRRPRHRPARGHPVRRRAPDARHRPRGVLRSARPHPRRADVGARREAGGDRPAPHPQGPRPRAGGHLHHPQRAARAAGRRPVHDPQPRPQRGRVPARRGEPGRAARPDGRRGGAHRPRHGSSSSSRPRPRGRRRADIRRTGRALTPCARPVATPAAGARPRTLR